MDSPFFSGATIEGRNFNEMEKGSTITLTCRVMEMEMETNDSRKGANVRHIEWMRNGEAVNIKVRVFPGSTPKLTPFSPSPLALC